MNIPPHYQNIDWVESAAFSEAIGAAMKRSGMRPDLGEYEHCRQVAKIAALKEIALANAAAFKALDEAR